MEENNNGMKVIILENDSSVYILLETMAGKGNEVGANFKEIRAIIDGCERKDRLGVCLDTCHINDAGYDVSDFDHVLDEFDRIRNTDLKELAFNFLNSLLDFTFNLFMYICNFF